MTKMLRLARLKRILSRYGGDVNYQQYFSVIVTFFTIVLLVRKYTSNGTVACDSRIFSERSLVFGDLITCFYYMTGDDSKSY